MRIFTQVKSTDKKLPVGSVMNLPGVFLVYWGSCMGIFDLRISAPALKALEANRGYLVRSE